jgi:hypothetical protein
MFGLENVFVCERGRRNSRASLRASLTLENLKLGGYLHCIGCGRGEKLGLHARFFYRPWIVLLRLPLAASPYSSRLDLTILRVCVDSCSPGRRGISKRDTLLDSNAT